MFLYPSLLSLLASGSWYSSSCASVVVVFQLDLFLLFVVSRTLLQQMQCTQKGLKRRRKRKELVSLASIRCYDVTKGEGGVVTALSVRTTHVLFYFNIYILVPFYFKGHEHTMEAEAAKSVM